MPYTVSQIAEIINGKLIGNRDAIVENHFFDSRNIYQENNAVFWAFKGKIDGSQFILEAYEKGIRVFISEINIEIPEDASLIIVNDTRKALQELSRYHLINNDLLSIGITGSNGKTMVKEWLFQCLFNEKEIIRSPKSYNSQIGLPFSLLQIEPFHEIGIFEVGISEPQEMQNLQRIFTPDIGILTNVKESHLENFPSYEALVKEKLSLFKNTSQLIYNIELEPFIDKEKLSSYASFGNKNANISISQIERNALDNFAIHLKIENEELVVNLPFNDSASLENVQCVVASLHLMGYSTAFIKDKVEQLQSIEMRLEIKNAQNNTLLIRDEFSLDFPSLEIGLNVLNQQNKEKKFLVLSDFEYKNPKEANLARVTNLLNSFPLNTVYFIGTQFQPFDKQLKAKSIFFENTKEALYYFENHPIEDSAILIKGARNFGLERISEALEEKSHETIMEISLHNMILNYNYFKTLLRPSTEIMAMVKANAYGLGLIEVAKTLEFYRVNYLGVAYADEGEELRKSGIQTPIMVMNPDESAFHKIIENRLEPEIYSIRVLNKFIAELQRKSISSPYPIHIKIDTGMHRLGFQANEIDAVASILKKNSQVKVISVFSHLSAADSPSEKEFTLEQIRKFEKLYNILSQRISYFPKKHILNTSGVLNYADYQFDMVRLGIGLYDGSFNRNLQTVVQLKSVISQIKTVEKGESISYGRKFIAKDPVKIAILPIGYADGLSRKLFDNKYKVLINNELCEIIAVVCMDMIMVDVTHITCNEGDEVIIFGNRPNLKEIAKASETITYNCLTSISDRIKRLYYRK